MNKGELISSCLKLMFDNDDEQIDPNGVSNETKYQSRTFNIIEAINRCLHRIDQFDKLPYKTFIISETTQAISKQYFWKYNLTDLISDYAEIDSIALENGYDYNENVSFRIEQPSTIVLEPLMKNAKYIITYRPLVSELTYASDDSEVIPYSNQILSIIPYGVKADLFEEDSSSLSNNARNIFENMIQSLRGKQYEIIREVKTIYGME